MKYIVALFCIVAYVAGNAVELKSSKNICACQDILDKILAVIEKQEGEIKQTNQELDEVEEDVNRVDEKVCEQGNRLARAEATLAVARLIQNTTVQALATQTNIFNSISSSLGDLSKTVDEVLNSSEDQACIIETLLSVSSNAEVCTNKQCHRP